MSTLASSARVTTNATLEKKASEDIDALKPGETEHPVQQIMLVHELALCTSLRQLTEHDLCALLERKLPSGRGLRPSEVQGNAPIMERLLDKLKGNFVVAASGSADYFYFILVVLSRFVFLLDNNDQRTRSACRYHRSCNRLPPRANSQSESSSQPSKCLPCCVPKSVCLISFKQNHNRFYPDF